MKVALVWILDSKSEACGLAKIRHHGAYVYQGGWLGILRGGAGRLRRPGARRRELPRSDARHAGHLSGQMRLVRVAAVSSQSRHTPVEARAHIQAAEAAKARDPGIVLRGEDDM